MDFNSLKDQVSNLTLYDLKASVRKVQNAVMNYTEMEAKVREATNNEPWGASSTLMQEIANGTFNYQTLNEIMPMIYRRFTEKAAEEWRQIYKALQLLEFLIKHGSERVIDDARSHLTLLKMLRQFHYIDQNGKDQGINVRNRAKELAELLSDVDRIRSERKKARANKAKFTGVEGGSGGGGFSSGFSSGSSGGRYGGFGSESLGYGGSGGGIGGSSSSGGNANFGGYSGGVYGDGGGFGGQTSEYGVGGGGGGGSRADKFEEYDEFDEGERPARTTTTASSSSAAARAGVRRTTGGGGGGSGSSSSNGKRAAPAAAAPKKKAPEVDLFSFDEPTSSAPSLAPAVAATSSSAAANNNDDDDDFDDFQSAAPAPTTAAASSANVLAGLSLGSPPLTTSNAGGAQFAAPQPVSAPQQANLSGMVSLSSISPAVTGSTATSSGANYSAFHATTAQAPKTSYQPTQPNYYQSVQASANPSAPGGTTTTSVFPQSTTTSVFPASMSTTTAASKSSSSSTTTAGMAALRPVIPSTTTASAAKPAASSSSAGGDAFGSLWSAASTGIKKTGTPTQGPSMGQLAQEKSQAAIWGAAPTSSSTASAAKPAPSGGSNGLDDLLG